MYFPNLKHVVFVGASMFPDDNQPSHSDRPQPTHTCLGIKGRTAPPPHGGEVGRQTRPNVARDGLGEELDIREWYDTPRETEVRDGKSVSGIEHYDSSCPWDLAASLSSLCGLITKANKFPPSVSEVVCARFELSILTDTHTRTHAQAQMS